MHVSLAETTSAAVGENSRGSRGVEDVVALMSFSGMGSASAEDTYIWFCEKGKIEKAYRL